MDLSGPWSSSEGQCGGVVVLSRAVAASSRRRLRRCRRPGSADAVASPAGQWWRPRRLGMAAGGGLTGMVSCGVRETVTWLDWGLWGFPLRGWNTESVIVNRYVYTKI